MQSCSDDTAAGFIFFYYCFGSLLSFLNLLCVYLLISYSPTNGAEHGALYGNFRGVDYANDHISQMRISSGAGGIQAETSDLGHVWAVKRVC